MAFFNYADDNGVALRLNNLKANNIYQLNNITNEYERVGTGGGGTGDLPYYLKSTDIEMNNEDTETGTILNDNSLIIGNSLGNETLTKDKINILTQVKTNIVDNSTYSSNINPFYICYDRTINKFVRQSDVTIGSATINYYMGTGQLTYNYYNFLSQLSAKFLLLRDGDANITKTLRIEDITATNSLVADIITPVKGSHYDGKYLTVYNKNLEKFERATEFNFGNSSIYSTMNAGIVRVVNGTSSIAFNNINLSFNTPSGSASLDYNNVKTLINLNNPIARALLGPNSKMIIFDTITKLYNYFDIPSGSASVPAYIQPNRIKFENDSSNYMEMQGNSYLKSIGNEGTNTFGAKVQNGKIVLFDFFTEFDPAPTTPIITLDNTKITFEDQLLGTTTILNKQLIDKIPNYYKCTVPVYSTAKWVRTIYSSTTTGTIQPYEYNLPDFPIRKIGDRIGINMAAWGYSPTSNDGLAFTADVFIDIQYPSFEIRYYNTSDMRSYIVLKNKNVMLKNISGSTTMYGTYFDIGSISGAMNGYLTIEVLEGTNFDHFSVNNITTFPGSVIP